MALKGMYFKCIDNTGVHLVKCIHVYNNWYIKPANIILVTVKKVLPYRKIKKGHIYKAVVVSLRKIIYRFYGVTVKFKQNSIIILKKTDLVPLASRVNGLVFFELRLVGFVKVCLISKYSI